MRQLLIIMIPSFVSGVFTFLYVEYISYNKDEAIRGRGFRSMLRGGILAVLVATIVAIAMLLIVIRSTPVNGPQGAVRVEVQR